MKCQDIGTSIEEILMNIGKGLEMKCVFKTDKPGRKEHTVLSITNKVRIILGLACCTFGHG